MKSFVERMAWMDELKDRQYEVPLNTAFGRWLFKTERTTMKIPSNISLALNYERLRENFDEKLSPEVKLALGDGNVVITRTDLDNLYKQHGLNSYERHLLYLKADADCLLTGLEDTLGHCQRISDPLPGCYDEAVVQVFAPLIAQKLEESRWKVMSEQAGAMALQTDLERTRQQLETISGLCEKHGVLLARIEDTWAYKIFHFLHLIP